ncbi:Lysine-specific demethylase 6A, variant 2 [Schistosoma haematobium]|uniref:Lysine-specific demethylase 6A, variant 2 n=2 Tax=Schistosoma haematobium TaxID=6185 RepID=A0A922S5V7_SCHHA|nr:Lysine-specific demethylase 6A, variant 2 [Schistosoma haematobium]KAH9594934.1 Lysine-specific demethylase 6A, variant 2 [Schistosoma haematobium]CAH8455581.1 unnamed protein product [Schistosoma haematobium]
MSTELCDSGIFSNEDCALLSQLDSLEFGVFKVDAPESHERRKLLEKAVDYFDSIISQTVLEIEEERAVEESETLTKVEAGIIEENPNSVRYKIYEKYSGQLDKLIEPQVYLHLGHFQLLLNRFDDALSAYLKFESLCPKESSINCPFLYGLGLCCFRFNVFNRTIRLFQQILYLQPWFPKCKEINIRLGYIYKVQNNFERSLRHFRQALNDSTPATFNRIELRFHIAHLFEVCGKPKQAKTEYFQLLDVEKSSAPSHIRHLCLRQLAWLHHTGAFGSKPESPNEKGLDVQWLQSALELDNTNGKTWYLLGRCQAALNHVQEAFAAYRSSIDKTEASADTWCSIGVLYQEQSQPMDALQAYFCAVQLDKCHVAAWANLGTLYESMQQYKEALKCYKNAVNADKHNEVRPEIRSRLAVLQQLVPKLSDKITGSTFNGPNNNSVTSNQVGNGPGPGCGGITKLPTVDEAWSLPIPAELTQRQLQLMLQEAAASDAGSGSSKRSDRHLAGLLLIPTPQSVLRKRSSWRQSGFNGPCETEGTDECGGSKRSRHSDPSSSTPVQPLSNQQLQLLHSLQAQGSCLTASQRQTLNNLQNQSLRYHHYKLIQNQKQLKTCKSGSDFADEAVSTSDSAGPFHGDTTATTGSSNAGRNPSSVPGEDTVDLFPAEDDDLTAVVDSPGSGNLPEEDLGFLTDDLLAQLNGSEAATGLDLVELALFTTGSSAGDQRPTSNNDNNQVLINEKSCQSKCGDSSTSGPSSSTPTNPPKTINLNAAKKDEIDMKNCLTQELGIDPLINSSDNPSSDPVDLHAYLTKPLNPPTSITAALHVNMSSSQILSSLRGLGHSGGPWWPGLLPEGSPIPKPPAKPYPPPPKDKLLPPTPSVYLENRNDAHSPELMRYCFTQPVVVIRGLAAALRLDLGLFSTKSLVESNPEHRVEVRTQRLQSPDQNLDSQGRTVWLCESPKTTTTIAKYGAYQAASFIEAMKEEKIVNFSGTAPVTSTPTSNTLSAISVDTKSSTGSLSNAVTGSGRKNSTHWSTESTNSELNTNQPHHVGNKISGDENHSLSNQQNNGRLKLIRFGTNCDLSDQKKWLPQLHELTKLPIFVRVVSAFSMLSHVGYPLLGLNTVQLYLKVPGSRTPGHQENNNFCAVNINIGPGDCEWFAVPEQYWGAIHNLCEKNNVDYLTGSWWPDLETLYKEEIPVYRFIQRPGDLVWINAGTVHWVQAIGWCNNIAWNVGCMTARQYQLAIERYEFNRLRGVKSVVPMTHLSWQLAKNIKISDPGLFELIKHTLLRSLIQSQLTTDFLEKMNLTVKHHGKRPDDIAHSCHDCEIEVFNILFVLSQDKKLVVRCLDCARRMDSTLKTFIILSEYYIHELAEIFDKFQLQTQPITAYPVGKT